MLRGDGEIAVLDVRKPAAFEAGHLLRAVNTPLASLVDLVRGFVPRLGTPLILCDAGDGLADDAAGRLAAMGYGDLYRLDGGVRAWSAAGFELFETGYAMANCFGLFIQEYCATPRIDGVDLKRRLDSGEPIVIVDSRPFEAYHAATVPGAVNVPVAELIREVARLATDETTTVVVHCGGKTRGVLGCQTLINAGFENPVVALDEGTGDWVMAGDRLETGAARTSGPASKQAKAAGREAAKRMTARFSVRTIAPEELDVWRRESDQRTLYVVDVRTPEEYEAGHLWDARSIPGGELAGCTEDHLATHNARLCLVDDDGARATVTASWMMQQGWPEVAVLAGGLDRHDLMTGRDPVAATPGPAEPSIHDTSPDAEIEACRQSFEWRQSLLERFRRDGTLSFVNPPM